MRNGEHRKTVYGYPLCDVIKILQTHGYEVNRRPPLNVYQVEHAGVWLGGDSIVVAESEARALSLVKFELAERKLPATDVRVVRVIPQHREQVILVNDGDY